MEDQDKSVTQRLREAKAEYGPGGVSENPEMHAHVSRILSQLTTMQKAQQRAAERRNAKRRAQKAARKKGRR
jgi:hypothetical protein